MPPAWRLARPPLPPLRRDAPTGWRIPDEVEEGIDEVAEVPLVQALVARGQLEARVWVLTRCAFCVAALEKRVVALHARLGERVAGLDSLAHTDPKAQQRLGHALWQAHIRREWS